LALQHHFQDATKTAAQHAVEVTLRIPGAWAHPGELIERMPVGYRLTPEKLLLPDRSEIEFYPRPPDDQFARVFQTSCRRPATRDELETIGRYTVNVCLAGPGGSKEAALRMLQAGAAIIQAGGAGVFIDNSALAHGGAAWLDMAEDGSPDAISFAFVSLIHGEREAHTMGMHLLGFPELVMRHIDVGDNPDQIIELLRYVCSSDKPLGDGHIVADELGPRYVAQTIPGDEYKVGSPMHNPFGSLRMTSFKEIAAGN
jgi:hypothetical protein